MDTNEHEYQRTSFNHKRYQYSSATLLPWHGIVSFVENPVISVVTPPNQRLEPFAKFAAGQVILPGNLRFCPFQYRVRPDEKRCLTTKSTKGTNFDFVPFVAIPGNRPAAEFCKGLNSSIRLLVFIRVHLWFVFPLGGYLFVAFVSLPHGFRQAGMARRTPRGSRDLNPVP
ncbi:MAG: hypothetical protein OXU26_09615 [Acidobacteriota bacterium]|nr:hypothetical protein [Acidobacteriota bacterium]MDE2964159.1 hypothetical protein [Acidobacteriota bacterium]